MLADVANDLDYFPRKVSIVCLSGQIGNRLQVIEGGPVWILMILLPYLNNSRSVVRLEESFFL